MDKDSNDPTSPDALEGFLDGLEEKIGPDFGMISSRSEMRDVKTEIAREMGVADEYHPNLFSAIEEHGEEGRDAHVAVEERYDALCRQGKIQKDPDWENPLEEWAAEINAHLEGQNTIYSDVDNEL